MIYINKFQALLLGSKASDKICEPEINKILLNIITNIWSKQVYLQGSDHEYISYKASVNMFERMEREGYNYGSAVETSY